MKKFVRSVLVLLGLLVVATMTAVLSPVLGAVVCGAMLLVSAIAVFRPMPALGLDSRIFAAVTTIFVALPGLMAASAMIAQNDLTRLADLREDNPVAYLEVLKAKDQVKWLYELQKLDPEQFEIENARIVARQQELAAAEKAKAEASEKERLEQLAIKQAEQQKARELEIVSYMEQIEREIASIPNASAATYSGNVSSINTALLLFGMWAELYKMGITLDLTPEQEQRRDKFASMAAAKQARMLPALRDAYGPAMRKQLWEADGSARTIGSGFRTVEFVSVAFAANANIKKIHGEMRENLLMLRFNRAQYKWFREASEYSYYTLEPPRDDKLVEWRTGGSFSVVF